MKNKELFDKTVSILVKAYQNDTLQHHNCFACAVGNLVASNMGFSLIPEKKIWDTYMHKAPMWDRVCEISQHPNLHGYIGEAKIQIDSTGYTPHELALIELAFESAIPSSDPDQDEDGYLGLMAVCDQLMLIHEATPQEAESAKLQFVKA